MNLFAKQKQTHNLENKSMVTKGEREVEERINQEVGINIYPQLCVKQIINKDPLPSIQNAIQYYVINYMGKESEKKNGFPGGSMVRNPHANAGDAGSIPGWGRSLGGGRGNPLQYS